MIIYTIGFTMKSAEHFFTALKQPGLERVIDVRLNNTNQLCGFTKKDDLRFFLKTISGIDYHHLPVLSPTIHLLNNWRKSNIDWASYEKQFTDLMIQRNIHQTVEKSLINGACLLCSEPTAQHCHRRLVAEFFLNLWGDVKTIHL